VALNRNTLHWRSVELQGIGVAGQGQSKVETSTAMARHSNESKRHGIAMQVGALAKKGDAP